LCLQGRRKGQALTSRDQSSKPLPPLLYHVRFTTQLYDHNTPTAGGEFHPLRPTLPPSSRFRPRPTAKMMMPSKPNRLQAIALGMRGVQFCLSLIITVIFLHLLSSSSLPSEGRASLKADIGIPLVFVFITLFHSIIAGGLTLFKKDRLLSAILDLVCLCGFVVTAVLMQGIAAGYSCPGWLTASHSQGGQLGTPMLFKRGTNSSECGLLKGVFGMAIIGCIVLLVTFLLGVYIVRRGNPGQAPIRRSGRHAAEEGKITERKNAPMPPRPDTSQSVKSHATEDRAFKTGERR